MIDVVIVGAGPAGLSAALLLGRCRRRVLVCDRGTPRNAASHALHGYLTRDGVSPRELRRIGRDELKPYGIEVRDAEVQDVQGTIEAFEVTLDTGDRLAARMVLLATGVLDRLPDIAGLRECFGISAFHCPYCDGWEVRDRVIAVLGGGVSGAGLALALKTWSERVILCSSGGRRVSRVHRAQLEAHGIAVHDAPIRSIEHEGGHVRRLVPRRGAPLDCDAIFIAAGQAPQSNIPVRLGCQVTRKGAIRTDRFGQTCVPGIYVVGDASRDVQFAIVAAAEGAKAAVAINAALQKYEGQAAALGTP